MKTRNSLLDSPLSTGSITTSRNLQNIKLPKFGLPSFQIGYIVWIYFYDCFKGAVNDNFQLTDSLMLQCLKSANNWDDSRMLSSINVTDDNFNVAMEILQNRYDIRRLILRAHIHGIVAQWAVPTENNRKQKWKNFSTRLKKIDFLFWTWDSR